MAITFVGSAKIGTTGGDGTAALTLALTSLAGGSDSAPSTGDLVLIVHSIDGVASTQGTPGISSSGWTSSSTLYSASTHTAKSNLSYKFMGGTPDTSVVTNAGALTNSGCTVEALVFRGVDSGTPFDVTITTATGTGSIAPDPPSITPTTTGAWVVIFGAASLQNEVFTPTVPSGFTDQVYVEDTISGAIVYNSIILAALDKTWSSGAVNASVWPGFLAGAVYGWGAWSIALRPGSPHGDQTESVTSAETLSAYQDAAPAQTESVTSADVQSATASGAASGAVAESVTASEALTGALVGATNLIEVVATSDAIGVSVVDNVNVAETLVLNVSINAILSGLPVTSPRFWRVLKWDAATGKRVTVSGIAPLYYLIRPSDGLWLDLLDGVFKSYSGCSLPKDTMTAVANIPGLYAYTLQSQQFSLNEQYYEFSEYYSTADNYFTEAVVLYVNGVEQVGGLTAGQAAQLGAIPTNPLLTADTRLNNLDATISSRAAPADVPTAPQNATAVRTNITAELADIVASSIAVLDIQLQIIILEKIARNNYTLSPADGTIKILDDDGVTVLYHGLAYSDAAGTILYNGTAPVHNTTRLS